MKLIAHRGLLNGPDTDLENNPFQIKSALNKGFDCEIDLWAIDNKFFLGHNNPTYEIPYNFLENPGLWIHAKNLDALYILGADPKLNFFWHQNDFYTLTSHGYIWTYPGYELTQNSIMVLPEWVDASLENTKNLNCFGICSDYVNIILNRN